MDDLGEVEKLLHARGRTNDGPRPGRDLESFCKKADLSFKDLAGLLEVDLTTLWRMRQKEQLPKVWCLALAQLERKFYV